MLNCMHVLYEDKYSILWAFFRQIVLYSVKVSMSVKRFRQRVISRTIAR